VNNTGTKQGSIMR